MHSRRAQRNQWVEGRTFRSLVTVANRNLTRRAKQAQNDIVAASASNQLVNSDPPSCGASMRCRSREGSLEG